MLILCDLFIYRSFIQLLRKWLIVFHAEEMYWAVSKKCLFLKNMLKIVEYSRWKKKNSRFNTLKIYRNFNAIYVRMRVITHKTKVLPHSKAIPLPIPYEIYRKTPLTVKIHMFF